LVEELDIGFEMASSVQQKAGTSQVAIYHCFHCQRVPSSIEDRLKQCAQCKEAFYCNVLCQKNHWGFHKLTCKRISLIAQNKAQISQNNAKIAQNNAKIGQIDAEISQKNAKIAENEAKIAENNAEIERIKNINRLADKIKKNSKKMRG
jgi:peptidoglycan hydrolase CwlO-like protein